MAIELPMRIAQYLKQQRFLLGNNKVCIKILCPVLGFQMRDLTSAKYATPELNLAAFKMTKLTSRSGVWYQWNRLTSCISGFVVSTPTEKTMAETIAVAQDWQQLRQWRWLCENSRDISSWEKEASVSEYMVKACEAIFSTPWLYSWGSLRARGSC